MKKLWSLHGGTRAATEVAELILIVSGALLACAASLPIPLLGGTVWSGAAILFSDTLVIPTVTPALATSASTIPPAAAEVEDGRVKREVV